MRGGDDRRAREHLDELGLGELAEQGPDAALDDRTRFVDSGPLPPIAPQQETHHATASELAFGQPVVNKMPTQKQDPAQRQEEVPRNWDKREVPPHGGMPLLAAFAAKFPGAAKIIEASPAAMQYVIAAHNSGAVFGGYAEEGPDQNPWAYTMANVVYVPKAQGDGIVAMSDFLFELGNAMHLPRWQATHKAARTGTLDRKAYARRTAEIELDGALQVAETWINMKSYAGKDKDVEWTQHDPEFFVPELKALKSGKKTKDQILTEWLHRKYTRGANAGMTPEDVYMAQYDDLFKKK